MARSNFVYTVTLPTGPGGSLVPVEGVGVTVFSVDPNSGAEGSAASFFAVRTGMTAGDTATDVNGTINIWLDSGDYNIHFEDENIPARLSSFVIGFDPNVEVDAVTTAVENVWFPGDLKWSTQASDHGLNAAGNHQWLLVVSDGDGGGRKVNATGYPGLWAQLGGPDSNPLDGSGNFRLPNISGRVLFATGTATGLFPVSLFTLYGPTPVFAAAGTDVEVTPDAACGMNLFIYAT